jgi:hypothetical protein
LNDQAHGGFYRLNINDGEKMPTAVKKEEVSNIWKVIFASSAGTLIEWYDFYIFGSLAVIIAGQFFPKGNPTVALLSTLATFATGFIVRPCGADPFVVTKTLARTRSYMGEETFKEWGWRIPFILSIVLVVFSYFIRRRMSESPVFVEMKSSGKSSLAPRQGKAWFGTRASVTPRCPCRIISAMVCSVAWCR